MVVKVFDIKDNKMSEYLQVTTVAVKYFQVKINQ